MVQQQTNVDYSEHILAFIDVLGFTDMVKASEKDRAIREKVVKLLTELSHITDNRNKSFSKGSPKARIKITTMSDSILVSSRSVSEDTFRAILWVLSEFYMKSIVNHSVFIRGLVTIGPYFEKENIAFGPVFIKAYEMERAVIKWPRCVIDPRVLVHKGINPKGSWRKRYDYILIDYDGLPYLDYIGYGYSTYIGLEIMGSIKSKNTNLIEILVRIFSAHKRRILSAIKSSSEKEGCFLLSKYYPIAQYHNLALKRLSGPNSQSTRDKIWNSMEEVLKKDGWNSANIKDTKNKINARIDSYKKQLNDQQVELNSVFQELLNPK